MSEIKPSDFKATVVRSKDYVSYLAIALLVIIIAGEIIFSLWLPRKLRSERSWEKESIMEDNIERLDNLRANLSSVKSRNSNIEGEVALALNCLDEIARYIRENKFNANLEQTVEINKILIDFNELFIYWKSGRSYMVKEKLDTSAFLKKIAPLTQNQKP